MRIVSGKYKGKQFFPPKGIKARPTTDFSKEGLFNVLNNKISFSEVSVLDLFAGTGNISFEFISRGCIDITCVDQSFESYRFIKSMGVELKTNINVIKSDVFKFISKKPLKMFDMIFADPPYAIENIEQIPKLIFENNWLNPDGILIVEHDNKTDLSKLNNFTECRNYGKVHFSFFNNQN
ncbi:MAG: 16S rRNA (guanine(966)-N(2))-methyltransferase RsmD [Bacteroidia bacterium]